MKQLLPFDHYLMGRLSTDHRVPCSALRRAISIDAQCSPFEVHLDPIKECGPSVLYKVALPHSARATQVTDFWPLGRLSLVDDESEQRRLLSVTASLWPLLCRPDTRAAMTTVRLGDPVLYAFQIKPEDRMARVFTSGAIGTLPAPRSHARQSFNWARDWLVTTLEEGGWRVFESAGPPAYGDIDWAIGQ
jgi:hypothetical protein